MAVLYTNVGSIASGFGSINVGTNPITGGTITGTGGVFVATSGIPLQLTAPANDLVRFSDASLRWAVTLGASQELQFRHVASAINTVQLTSAGLTATGLNVTAAASGGSVSAAVENTGGTAVSTVSRLAVGMQVTAGTALLLQFDHNSGEALIFNRKTTTGTLKLQTTGGGLTIANDGIVTSTGKIIVSNTAPEVAVIDTDGTSGYRWWRYIVNSDTFFFQRLNDTGTVVNDTPMQFAFNGVVTFSQSVRERARTKAMGEWTYASWVAGDYTANGSMVWTVDSGDFGTLAYSLVGKTMTLVFYLANTSISGTPSNILLVRIPGAVTATQVMYNLCQVIDNSVGLTGVVRTTIGSNQIQIFRIDGANWQLSTNGTGAAGQITFEIT